MRNKENIKAMIDHIVIFLGSGDSLYYYNSHKICHIEEVSLAHLVREVDVQPSHPGSSLHRCEFGFLFFKKTKSL
jgi:hypothetical protein